MVNSRETAPRHSAAYDKPTGDRTVGENSVGREPEGEPLFHPLRIGSVHIPGNVFLAPLAGYTDKAFREISREFGASFCYTEMVSAEAIARDNEKSLRLMERGDDERQLGIQLFLSTPEQAERALPRLLEYDPTVIDINCGCPVPKVVKTGAGAALMQHPSTIRRIVETLVKETGVPVTVKIRSGWDTHSINFLEAASAAQDGGGAAIGLHARTRVQGYSGTANWCHIAELASASPVPVIGSGDLFSAESIRNMLSSTGCDGVMCARGAIGNPFLFAHTSSTDNSTDASQIETGQVESAQIETTRIETAMRHFEKARHYRGDRVAVREMKKHFSAYTKGLENGSALRDRLMRCTDTPCYYHVFNEYLTRHEGRGNAAVEGNHEVRGKPWKT